MSDLAANTIKNAILEYYRFQRGYFYLATEYLDRDVVVSDGRVLVEVEVKISWHDYLREWRKSKHQPKATNYQPFFKPNRLFFAAPDCLALKIKDDIIANQRIYGVISYDANTGQIAIIHKAKEVHAEKVSSKVLDSIIRRLSSELLTVRKICRS